MPRTSPAQLLGEPWSLLAACRYLVGKFDIKIIQSRKGVGFEPDIINAARDTAILGISCMTGYPILEALRASQFAKTVNPSIKVVWGGWHPSACPEQVVENRVVDVAVVGQGERTFLELATAVQNGMPFNDIPGIVFKRGKEIVRNAPRPFENINNFPPIPHELIDSDVNLRPTVLGKRTIHYQSSQGCPHRCTFCAVQSVYHSRWSGLKPDRVANEIGGLIDRYGIDSVTLDDANFFVDLRRVHEIARLFIERKFNIRWGNANGCAHHLLKMPHETWRLLADSGCSDILIGAESGLQEGLDLIDKGCTVDETVALVKLSNSYGIPVHLSMMVGLPYETDNLLNMAAKELKAILEMMGRIHQQTGRWNPAFLFLYTPYPGTPLFHLSVKRGLIPPQRLEEWATYDLNTRNTPWVPRDIVRRVALISEYVWGWLSPDYMATIRGIAGWKRLPALVVAMLFTALCKVRWTTQFFSVPIDYFLFKACRRYFKP